MNGGTPSAPIGVPRSSSVVHRFPGQERLPRRHKGRSDLSFKGVRASSAAVAQRPSSPVVSTGHLPGESPRERMITLNAGCPSRRSWAAKARRRESQWAFFSGRGVLFLLFTERATSRRVGRDRRASSTRCATMWLEDYACGESHRDLSSVAGVRWQWRDPMRESALQYMSLVFLLEVPDSTTTLGDVL
jgi:hypothetical protein